MTAESNRIFVQSVKASRRVPAIAQALSDGLTYTGRMPTVGARWIVKLNLTYPRYLPGVVNSPEFVEGMCQWARDARVHLTFIEGDGGNGSYSAEDTLRNNGVCTLAEHYGMATLSISPKPWEWLETDVGRFRVRLPYSPMLLRRDFDAFVSAPLFKNHVVTTVTLGMKNLWGCIPDAYRMYYHPDLHPGIVALAKELRPDFSIFDGVIALRGAGPMDGDPVETNYVMVAGSLGAGEVAALELMSIPLDKVRHLALASGEGLLPTPVQLQWSTSPEVFRRRDFIVRRTMVQCASIFFWKWKLPRLQRFVYHSRWSRYIYSLVDRLRPNSPTADLVRAKRKNAYSTIPRD